MIIEPELGQPRRVVLGREHTAGIHAARKHRVGCRRQCDERKGGKGQAESDHFTA